MNTHFKHIVVGVDFSRYSLTAVKEARALAEKMNLPITYVHVFDYFQTLGDTIQQYEENVRQRVAKLYKVPKESEIILRLGDPAQQIVDAAKQLSSSPLIIVGYRGQGRIRQFFLGSTAEKVATISPFPVWIHRGSRTVIPKKVLVPSDFTQRTDVILNSLKDFENLFKADVELYHIIPQAIPILDYPVYKEVEKRLNEEDDKLYENFISRHPDVKTVRSKGNVFEKIESRAKKFNVIALSPRGKSQIMPLLGRTATKIVRSSKKPILVCP